MASFRERISPFIEIELGAAWLDRARGDAAAEFTRLERAHVLAQSDTRLHVLVHASMLLWGVRQRSTREVFGQLLRIAGAATKTVIGLVPHGNTGGANVSAFRRMPIAPELQRLIDAAGGQGLLTLWEDTRRSPAGRTPPPPRRVIAARHAAALAAACLPTLTSTSWRHPMFRSLLVSLSVLALVATAGCAAPPADLDLSLKHASSDGRFVVTLQPPATTPAINQMHSWKVLVSTPAGLPVREARIAVDGGMPQHGHGLPTRPQVRPAADAGTYLLEGMKFSMTGWWEIKLAIQTPDGTDRVTFNTVVASPTAAR